MRSLLLLFCGASVCLMLASCSKQQANNLAQPVVPMAPPVSFELSATAKRLDRNHVLIEVADSSSDGARVMKTEKPNIGELKDADGNTIRASLRDYRIVRAEDDSGEDSEKTFLLQLVMQGAFPEQIGLLRGTFEVVLGDPEDLSLAIESEGDIAPDDLQQFGIKLEVDFQTKLSVDLKGKNVALAHLVLAEGDDENAYGSFASAGSDKAARSWTLGEKPNSNQEIRFWTSESKSEEEPAWVIKPVEPGTIINSELGISGQIQHQTVCKVVAIGPTESLMSVRLLDANGELADQRPSYRVEGPNHKWTFDTTKSDCRLELKVAHNPTRATELLEFTDLKIEPAR